MKALIGALLSCLMYVPLVCGAATPVVPFNITEREYPISNAKFEVSVDYDNQTCRGVLTIKRSNASTCPPHDAFVSSDAETEKIIKNTIGPDSFVTKIRGPEVIHVPVWHKGQCVYEGAFNLSLPGPHKVYIDHVYEDFIATTEEHTDDDWWTQQPRNLMNLNIIKRDSIELQCIAPEQDPAVHKYIMEGRLETPGAFDAGLSFPPKIVMNMQRQKPTCTDGLAASDGRWIYQKPTKAHKPLLVPPTKEQEDEAGAAWKWAPYTCHLPAMEYGVTETNECLKNKGVQVIGDGQQHSIFHKLARHFLRQQDEYTHVGASDDVTVLRPPENDSSAFLQFNKDPFLELHGLKRTDVGAVFLGFGSVPAGVQGKWTLRKFKKELTGKMVKISYSVHHKNMSVWWVGMPASPHPWKLDSRRSHDRMRLMDLAAFAKMERRKIPYIDLFAISVGMSEYSSDYSRYTGFVAETMSRVIVQLLCNLPEQLA